MKNAQVEGRKTMILLGSLATGLLTYVFLCSVGASADGLLSIGEHTTGVQLGASEMPLGTAIASLFGGGLLAAGTVIGGEIAGSLLAAGLFNNEKHINNVLDRYNIGA